MAYRTRNFEQQKLGKAVWQCFSLRYSAVHILEDSIAEVSSFLMLCILVQMFAGEGKFVVQAIGEKDLIEARVPVFKSHRGSVKKEPPHAGKRFIEHLLYFC